MDAEGSLVIRLRRRRSSRRALSEIKENQEPTSGHREVQSPVPILKPKKAANSAKKHTPRQTSASIKIPGVHFTTAALNPPNNHITSYQLYKFPTTLLLRLLSSKRRTLVPKTAASPSLKYVNLQCPVVRTTPSPVIGKTAKRSGSNLLRKEVRGPERRESSFSVRQLVGIPLGERGRTFSLSQSKSPKDVRRTCPSAILHRSNRPSLDSEYDPSHAFYYL